MSDRTNRYTAQPLTFEDLRGLRAEGYVRDSTLDQRDGFGPDIQRNNIIRFAESYGLVLGDKWYTEFVSGRSVKKRTAFMQFVEDAELDKYEVLLVDHTSRFGRNQEECIRYKALLRDLGKIVVFVNQGIISGSDRDFLSERINETLDEAYSRNLSRYTKAGLYEKVSQGYSNGVPPLGYKSQKLPNGKRARKIVDPKSLPSLLTLLRAYASGEHSFLTVAQLLNSKGYRNRMGEPFLPGNIKAVLDNRFYDQKVIYHRGQPDEEIVDGIHDVPDEIRALWQKCQSVRKGRVTHSGGHPRVEGRSYPFTRRLRCASCGNSYYGEAVGYRGKESLRLVHERRKPDLVCSVRPKSIGLDSMKAQFSDRVLSYMRLDHSWMGRILRALEAERPTRADPQQVQKLNHALANLRKQHLWGDLSDDTYLSEKRFLERELKVATPQNVRINMPNLERAGELLNSLPTLWSHPGVDNAQCESLVSEVFRSVSIKGRDITAIEPHPKYAPLFAAIVTDPTYGYREFDPCMLKGRYKVAHPRIW